MSNTLKSCFAGNKEKDLGDKSNDGDERKKAKEDSLDLSLKQDDAPLFILQGVHQHYMTI